MKNKDKVTIAVLEREIVDLREGMRKMTLALADERRRAVDLERELGIAKRDAVQANDEVIKQQEFQSRAHETIERLGKVALALTEK